MREVGVDGEKEKPAMVKCFAFYANTKINESHNNLIPVSLSQNVFEDCLFSF